MTSFKTTKVANDLLRLAHDMEIADTIVEGGEEWDLWETTNRIFVSDLPIWERFLIWLFPRMYDLRDYP